MLDLKLIENTTVCTDPWGWAVVENVFESAAEAAELCREFPKDRFHWFYSGLGAKRYRYWGRFLIEPGASDVCHPDDLSNRWLSFARDTLLTTAYRTSLGKAIGQDLLDAKMEATFWRYDPGCWFSAHVGSPDRIVNQVIYFNEKWEEKDGGYLQILASDHEDEPAATVEPLVNRSALIVRSDNSWHAIDPVTTHRGPSRQTVVVSFRH